MAYKLYKGGQNLKKVYAGKQYIKKIYKGTALVWQADPYDPGATVWYQTGPGTFETELEVGVYDLIIAGAGGDDVRWAYGTWFHNHGGSGAAWEGQFYNPVKQYCKIYVGGIQNETNGQDSFLELGGVRMITAGGGKRSTGTVSGYGGDPGIISVNSSLQILEQRKSTNGNTGGRGVHNDTPTASVCSLNNWGQGGGSPISVGGNVAISGGAQFRYIRLDR